ncbi:MAG: DUF86 domain-containing protein [Myxococcota bacterium]
MTVDREVILRHLSDLKRCVGVLERHRDDTIDDLRADEDRLGAVLYWLQRAVQNVLDVAAHLVAASGGRFVEEYRAVVLEVGRLGLVGSDVAQRLADAAGFRNVSIHNYLELDLAVVQEVLRSRLGDFAAFCAQVKARLGTGGTGSDPPPRPVT